MVRREKSVPGPLFFHMARFARAIAVGAPHHITQRGTGRQPVFFTRADREVYLDWLRTSAQQARLRILAYCLMPNHVHLVAAPDEPDSLAIALRRAHGRYATYLNARRGRTGHLWQNRFYSCALDAAHFPVAIRYVERNPVRAGLAERVEQYPWSSAAARLSGHDPRNILDLDCGPGRGEIQNWGTLLESPEDLDSIRKLQQGTFSGRPVGSADFVEQLEHRLGRQLRAHQGVRVRSAAA